MKTVSSIDELVKALGGVTSAAEAFGEKTNVVGNWQLREKLPANKFLAHQEVLKERGLDAPPALWFKSDAPEPAEARG